jgi:hypothetical protein
MQQWLNLCNTEVKDIDLSCACDVSIAYLINSYNKKNVNNRIEIYINDGFYACNYQGHPYCCVNKINVENILSCHFMSLEDFDTFTKILENNNYFLDFSF